MSFWSHPFEVSGGLNLPDGLHEGVSDDDANVSTRVTVRLLAQSHEVWFGETGRCAAQIQLEHESASVLFRKRNVDTFLKSKHNTEDKQWTYTQLQSDRYTHTHTLILCYHFSHFKTTVRQSNQNLLNNTNGGMGIISYVWDSSSRHPSCRSQVHRLLFKSLGLRSFFFF